MLELRNSKLPRSPTSFKGLPVSHLSDPQQCPIVVPGCRDGHANRQLLGSPDAIAQQAGNLVGLLQVSLGRGAVSVQAGASHGWGNVPEWAFMYELAPKALAPAPCGRANFTAMVPDDFRSWSITSDQRLLGLRTVSSLRSGAARARLGHVAQSEHLPAGPDS
jgi:hypothetical protein